MLVSWVSEWWIYQSWALATILATTRQCLEAKKLSLVVLSLIFRIMSRCRCRKEVLSLIRDKYCKHLIGSNNRRLETWRGDVHPLLPPTPLSYVQVMCEVFTSYMRVICELCASYVWVMCELCESYVRVMWELFESYVWVVWVMWVMCELCVSYV